MKNEFIEKDNQIKTKGLFTKFIAKCNSSYSYGY